MNFILKKIENFDMNKRDATDEIAAEHWFFRKRK